MKKIYSFFALCLSLTASQAQVGFNTYYQYSSSPMVELKSAHGFGIDIYSSLKNSNYSLGLSYSIGVYGFSQAPINLLTSDGTILNTNVNVTNAFHAVSFYHKYSFRTFSGIITPFIDARTGWSFFRTNLVIEDPDDVSNCEPLEQETLLNDNTWNVYAGGGVELKLNGLFKTLNKTTDKSGIFFNLGFGYNFGGVVSYMHVNGTNISGSPHSQHTVTNAKDNSTSTPYYSSFINTQTQIVHEHHTGYVYTSQVRMFQLKIGFALKF